MKFSIESKYEPGDIAYRVTGVYSAPQVQPVTIKSVDGLRGDCVIYTITPVHKQFVVTNVLEVALYATRAEAAAAGNTRAERLKATERQAIIDEIASVEVKRNQDIDEINDAADAELRQLNKELKEL